MDKLDYFRPLAAVFGGLTSFLFGGWSSLLTALLFFVVVDYLTGVMAAGKEGKLSSQVGFWGIAKKFGVFVVIAIAHRLDHSFGTGDVMRDAAIWFYLANEALSILENLGRLGVPIPSFIQQGVKVLNEKANRTGRER